MTTTTPPQETRTRRPRRAATGDAEETVRPARRRVPPQGRREVPLDGTARAGTRNTTVKSRTATAGAPKTRAATTTDRSVRTAGARRPSRRNTAPVAARRSATPRAPFVLLVIGLLGGALVSLLLLNTVLAQDAFTLSELQRGNQQLNERKQALQEDIDRESSPAVLHAKARGLGMVDGQRPAFIDPRTGRVTEGGARPPGVSNEAMAAAAAAGVAGTPGAIMPPAGGAPPASATHTGTAGTGTPGTPGRRGGGTR